MQQVTKTEKRSKQLKQKLVTVLTVSSSKNEHDCLSWIVCYDDMCTTYRSDKNNSEWFSRVFKRMQQLQVTEKEKKSQLWVELKKGAYMIDWLLLSEVEQDDVYKVIRSSNSNKEYEMISFSVNDKLFKNQKTSLSVTVNKFYSEI